ncbi:prolyl oligopeptidase family serine peptidase [Actinoplanes sp. NPDC051470]|uniref:S9 family peptidase n=1 Tax=unclassified Actinoplanes TaxID=2626549 RepID=UPI00341CCBD3
MVTNVDPFADLDVYAGLPRVAGLWLAPDGSRVVVGVSTPDRKNTRYVTALWEVDPDGRRPARRLTRSSEGESAAAFTPDGDLLFASKRTDPEAEEGAEARTAVWVQPAGSGDARVLATPPGGVRGLITSASGTVVLGSDLMPSAADVPADQEIRRQRKDGGVSAILHSEYPPRHWDQDLGPDRTRLLAVGADREPRDLTGHVGRALEDGVDWDISPDGGTVVTMWVSSADGDRQVSLVAIDVATGERRTLAEDPALSFASPRISPDGTRVAVVVWRRATPAASMTCWLGVVPLAGGPVRDLTRDWDRWPDLGRWTPDGASLVVIADDRGRSPLWRVDAADGSVTRLTPDDGAYTDVRVAPDGRWAYALRATVDRPPAPVRVALTGAPAFEPLLGPADELELPGRLTEVTATAEDGTPLRAWLALPHHADADSPVPMLLWVHGGPRHSWNSWSWRWNPWIAVADGYAVLLPDPALSTGYGYHFMERGWSAWGDKPYTDLMALTDAAVARADLDESRTAAMGGSFGGYMANWIAGHTDRFTAIVTHASLWALDQFAATTDTSDLWARELPAPVAAANSPHDFADRIRTPMLIIHGDRDYRVPIGEALRLWWDLQSRAGGEPSPHRFLYFPDENHWILKPGNAKAWYATVLAFLAHHVRGEKWQAPDVLG